MQTETQPQDIVLIEPSDEQAWPSFHIVDHQLEPFLDFLRQHHVELVHPVEPLGNLGPNGHPLFEIEIPEEHSVEQLESILASYLEQQTE